MISIFYLDMSFISPTIIPSILAIIQGKSSIAMEELAGKIGIPIELMEICLKMTKLSNNDRKLQVRLNKCLTSPIMYKFWDVIKVTPDLIETLLHISFNDFSARDFEKIAGTFQVKGSVDTQFLFTVFAISKSYLAIQGVNDIFLDRKSNLYTSTLNDMKDGVKLYCKLVNLDETTIVPLMRLRQGDFFILEEYKSNFIAILPTQNIRKIVMGMSGIVTLPIRFSNVVREKAKNETSDTSLTFENAINILSKELKISPFIAKLAALDNTSIELLAKEANLPVSIVFILI